VNVVKPPRSQADLHIAEQAAQWLLEIEEGGPAAPADFAAWLKTSPVHVDEFLMVTSVWKAFDGMDAAKRMDVERMVEEARKAVQADIAPVRGSDSSAQRRSLFRPRRAFVGFALATSLLLACMVLWLVNSSARTFATTTGEQRAFKLEDGSIVHLNTESRVSVEFTASARTVRLMEGEALFTVERDPKRPFRVEAGRVVFQAVGTQFNVYRRANTTTISVVEGVVQIQPEAPATARLAAGEQADVTDNGSIEKHKVSDLEQVTAWRQRRLVFRGELLADVAREFNRYNQLRIEIESPEIRTKRLTGVFNADDPQSLVLFLSGDPQLSIESTPQAVHIRHR
jgi:transmembrane sensor